MRVGGGGGGGGGTRHVRGGAGTHISTELSKSEEGSGVVRRRLELHTSWRDGTGTVRLEGEANLPQRSQAYLFVSSECLLTILDLMLKYIKV
jgi:hypothetical protein